MKLNRCQRHIIVMSLLCTLSVFWGCESGDGEPPITSGPDTRSTPDIEVLSDPDGDMGGCDFSVCEGLYAQSYGLESGSELLTSADDVYANYVVTGPSSLGAGVIKNQGFVLLSGPAFSTGEVGAPVDPMSIGGGGGGLCGNGMPDPGEDCEPGDQQDCSALGFDVPGVVMCNLDCAFNTDDCVGMGNQAFVSVAVADYHACALDTQGSVVCWGSNFSGESTAPGGTYEHVVVGDSYSCGVTAQETVVCWGDERGLLNGVPARDLASGPGFACYNNMGAVNCAALDQSMFPVPIMPPLTLTNMAVGGAAPSTRAVCALDDSTAGPLGSASYCWTSADGVTADLEPGSITVEQIDVGGGYACGVDANQALQCFEFTGAAETPADVPMLTSFIQVATGSTHACGIEASQSLVCWDGYGTTNDSDLEIWSAGARSSGVLFEYVAMNDGFTERLCAIEGGGERIKCHGGDAFDGEIAANVPLFGQHRDIDLIDTSPQMGCALNSAGALVCWGGSEGMDPVLNQRPMDPANPVYFSALSLNFNYACGIKADNTQPVQCWGNFVLDGLAMVDTTNAVDVQISATHGCILTDVGELRCWDQQAPTTTASNVVDFAVGTNETCYIEGVAGVLTCTSQTPPLIMGSTRVALADLSHGCVITDLNDVECWTSETTMPTWLDEMNNDTGSYDEVWLSNSAVCARRSSGDETVLCFGADSPVVNVPQVPLRDVTLAFDSACGIRSDTDEVICWGAEARNIKP